MNAFDSSCRAGGLTTLAESWDMLVVGAGPAGMAAARRAANSGLSVLVADENAGPGGQIWRNVSNPPMERRDILGVSYWAGEELAQAFLASDAVFASRTTVWSIAPLDERGFEVGLSQAGAARLIRARHVVVASGALERPVPLPGWTLPGVMTAGAAQTALKASGLVPEGRVAIAGTGPLLLLVALQLRRAGVEIVAVIDTSPASNRRRALRHLADFLRSAHVLPGLQLLTEGRSLPMVRGASGLEAMGNDCVEAVRYEARNGTRETACDVLLLHQGVVPNPTPWAALRCAQSWDTEQLCWRPNVDEWFQSSIPDLHIAGDSAGILGAAAATLTGELAAFGVLAAQARMPAGAEREVARLRAALRRQSRGRPFLDALYRPAHAARVPVSDDTIVCRCEEVTAGQIRAAVDMGATGPNQAKAFLRCGMGPCQGRLCGLTVSELIADRRGRSAEEVGSYRLRPPFKPLTLGEYADLPVTEAAVMAVDRPNG